MFDLHKRVLAGNLKMIALIVSPVLWFQERMRRGIVEKIHCQQRRTSLATNISYWLLGVSFIA